MCYNSSYEEGVRAECADPAEIHLTGGTMMKKVFALLLVLSMVFALCACGKDTAPETTAAAPKTEQAGRLFSP